MTLKNNVYDIQKTPTIKNIKVSFYLISNIWLLFQVLLDGKNIKELNTCWLRNNIGVVSQEPILFGMTIAENIKLGNTDATIQEIEDAAKAANAHDFITKLPNVSLMAHLEKSLNKTVLYTK